MAPSRKPQGFWAMQPNQAQIPTPSDNLSTAPPPSIRVSYDPTASTPQQHRHRHLPCCRSGFCAKSDSQQPQAPTPTHTHTPALLLSATRLSRLARKSASPEAAPGRLDRPAAPGDDTSPAAASAAAAASPSAVRSALPRYAPRVVASVQCVKTQDIRQKSTGMM